MKDLLARLEAAEEGSRALTEALAVDWGWKPDQTDLQGSMKWIAPGERHTRYLPPFTESLDAAVSLIPDHYLWQIKRGIACEAIVWSLEMDYDEQGAPFGAHESSPALALCIALKKAKEHDRR